MTGIGRVFMLTSYDNRGKVTYTLAFSKADRPDRIYDTLYSWEPPFHRLGNYTLETLREVALPNTINVLLRGTYVP